MQQRITKFVLIAGVYLTTGAFSVRTVLGLAQAQDTQQPQVIEMTARNYVFSPSPVHVKQGATVRFVITSTEHNHGIKLQPRAKGAAKDDPPGLEFASDESCTKLPKGVPTTVEFVAKTAGTYSFDCCVVCGMGHRHMKGTLIVDP